MPRPLGLAPQVADRQDRASLLLATGAIMLVFAIGTAVQTVYVYGHLPAWSDASVWPRIAANLVAVAATLAVLAGLNAHRGSAVRAVLVVLVAGPVAAVCRAAVQLVTGVYPEIMFELVADAVSCAVVGWTSGVLGLALMVSRRRLRRGVESAADNALRIELALQALQYEEIRVRREVAEGLHGTVQQRLVLVVARMDRILDHVRDLVPPVDLEALREVREQLEEVRENDVRATSRMLYPDQLEIGMVPAVRALLGRIPTSIATRLVVTDEVRALDDPAEPGLTQAERLLAVRVVEEAVSNSLRHGRATSIEVHLELTRGRLTVRVDDDGVGLPEPVVASGTARLRDRLALAGGSLTLGPRPGEGARLQASVPLVALGGPWTATPPESGITRMA